VFPAERSFTGALLDTLRPLELLLVLDNFKNRKK